MSEKITLTITEEDIKRQVLNRAINFDAEKTVHHALQRRDLEPVVRELIKEKIKEALKYVDTEYILKKAENTLANQLRKIAKEMMDKQTEEETK